MWRIRRFLHLLYVSYLGEQAREGFAIAVSTWRDPVDSTVEILKNQLIIVSFIFDFTRLYHLVFKVLYWRLSNMAAWLRAGQEWFFRAI